MVHLPTDIAPLIFLYISFVVFIAFFIRSLVGFGGALISIPLLALVFDVSVVVPVEAVFEVIVSLLLLPTVRKKIIWNDVLLLFIGSAIGTILGSAALQNTPPILLKKLLGLFTLLMAFYLLHTYRSRDNRKDRYEGYQSKSFFNSVWGIIAGFAGGTLGGLFGQSGPPYTIYLSYQNKGKDYLRATLIAVFALDYAWRIGFFSLTDLINATQINLVLILFPAFIIGTLSGAIAHRYVSAKYFEYAIVVILLLSGISNLLAV